MVEDYADISSSPSPKKLLTRNVADNLRDPIQANTRHINPPITPVMTRSNAFLITSIRQDDGLLGTLLDAHKTPVINKKTDLSTDDGMEGEIGSIRGDGRREPVKKIKTIEFGDDAVALRSDAILSDEIEVEDVANDVFEASLFNSQSNLSLPPIRGCNAKTAEYAESQILDILHLDSEMSSLRDWKSQGSTSPNQISQRSVINFDTCMESASSINSEPESNDNYVQGRNEGSTTGTNDTNTRSIERSPYEAINTSPTHQAPTSNHSPLQNPIRLGPTDSSDKTPVTTRVSGTKHDMSGSSRPIVEFVSSPTRPSPRHSPPIPISVNTTPKQSVVTLTKRILRSSTNQICSSDGLHTTSRRKSRRISISPGKSTPTSANAALLSSSRSNTDIPLPSLQVQLAADLNIARRTKVVIPTSPIASTPIRPIILQDSPKRFISQSSPVIQDEVPKELSESIKRVIPVSQIGLVVVDAVVESPRSQASSHTLSLPPTQLMSQLLYVEDAADQIIPVLIAPVDGQHSSPYLEVDIQECSIASQRVPPAVAASSQALGSPSPPVVDQDEVKDLDDEYSDPFPTQFYRDLSLPTCHPSKEDKRINMFRDGFQTAHGRGLEGPREESRRRGEQLVSEMAVDGIGSGGLKQSKVLMKKPMRIVKVNESVVTLPLTILTPSILTPIRIPSVPSTVSVEMSDSSIPLIPECGGFKKFDQSGNNKSIKISEETRKRADIFALAFNTPLPNPSDFKGNLSPKSTGKKSIEISTPSMKKSTSRPLNSAFKVMSKSTVTKRIYTPVARKPFTPKPIQKGTPKSIQKGTPNSIQKGIPNSIQKGIPNSIQKGTPKMTRRIKRVSAIRVPETRVTLQECSLRKTHESVTYAGCRHLKFEGKGLEEAEREMVEDGLDVSRAWIINHWMLIAWKCECQWSRLIIPKSSNENEKGLGAGIEQGIEKFKEIKNQMVVRFLREYEGVRSCLKGMIERDTSSSLHIVLFVVSIDTGLVLSDGHYTAKTRLDPYLSLLVRDQKVRVGMKLHIQNAHLSACDPCGPLEQPSHLQLSIHSNGVKRAKWHTSLGYQRLKVYRVGLGGIVEDGGIIGVIDVIIKRRFKTMLIGKREDGSVSIRQADGYDCEPVEGEEYSYSTSFRVVDHNATSSCPELTLTIYNDTDDIKEGTRYQFFNIYPSRGISSHLALKSGRNTHRMNKPTEKTHFVPRSLLCIDQIYTLKFNNLLDTCLVVLSVTAVPTGCILICTDESYTKVEVDCSNSSYNKLPITISDSNNGTSTATRNYKDRESKGIVVIRDAWFVYSNDEGIKLRVERDGSVLNLKGSTKEERERVAVLKKWVEINGVPEGI